MVKKGGKIGGIVTKTGNNKNRETHRLHNVVMRHSTTSDLVVDHIDGNVFNNRKSNLRIVTAKENASNKSSISKNISGYTNIYKEKDDKYAVRINGKRYGRYKSLNEAISIRDEKIKKIFPLRSR